ncbi:hypothetical protein [Moraxella phage Mcat2]|nr:hypothetical protein [Moraxella phage Mcat2]
MCKQNLNFKFKFLLNLCYNKRKAKKPPQWDGEMNFGVF